MVFHATVNTLGPGLIFSLFKGGSFVASWYVSATLWLIMGFAAGIRRGGSQPPP